MHFGTHLFSHVTFISSLIRHICLQNAWTSKGNTASVRKRQRATQARKRRLQTVNLGNALNDWNFIKDHDHCKTDEEIAQILINSKWRGQCRQIVRAWYLFLELEFPLVFRPWTKFVFFYVFADLTFKNHLHFSYKW